MIGRKVLESKNASLAEVSKILGDIPETELGFEQMKALEYSKSVAKLTTEKAESLVEELLAAVEKIDRAKAVKLADLLPASEGEVRAVFVKEMYSLTEDEINKILEAVKKYR